MPTVVLNLPVRYVRLTQTTQPAAGGPTLPAAVKVFVHGVKAAYVVTPATALIRAVAVHSRGPQGLIGNTGPAGGLGPTGLTGAKGDRGTPGGLVNFTHVQAAPATAWIMQHNLGRYPAVTVVDSAGTLVVGTVTHSDSNNCTVSFSVIFSGTATLV